MIRQLLRLTQAVHAAAAAGQQARQARLLAEDARARLVRVRDALLRPADVTGAVAAGIATAVIARAATTLDPQARAVLDRLRAGQAHDAARSTSPVPTSVEPHGSGRARIRASNADQSDRRVPIVAEETDGIEEAFEGQLRVLVTAAGQLGERIARAREEALRRAQVASEQEARELTSRLAAEQRAARTELGGVYRSEWWERATPEQIGHRYQVARAWSQEDPEAARAQTWMRDELRTRYGLDVDHMRADPAAVRAAIERAEQDRAQADAERTRAAAENTQAQRLMQQADREDARDEQARAAAEHEPDPDERARAAAEARRRETNASQKDQAGRTLYDSAERRAATAGELEAKGIDRELVATRMRADISQAEPATAAVKSTGVKSPKARKVRGRGAQVQRTGLDR